jgi:hypothetical protein
VQLAPNFLDLDPETANFHGLLDTPKSPTPTGVNTPRGSISSGVDCSSLDERLTAAAREYNRTWEPPSLDKLVDALQVAMITKRDSIAPIPVRFNAHVLYLIEGYRKQQKRLAEAAEEAAEAKRRLEAEREHVRSVAQMWSRREEDYRQEVKRLELLLAKTSSEGTAAVVMARRGSLVDRAAGKRFRERLERLGTGQNPEGSFLIRVEMSWATLSL